jgi:hypothetical protein
MCVKVFRWYVFNIVSNVTHIPWTRVLTATKTFRNHLNMVSPAGTDFQPDEVDRL